MRDPEMRRRHASLPGSHLELPFLLAIAGQDGSAFALPRLSARPRLVAAAPHCHDDDPVRGLQGRLRGGPADIRPLRVRRHDVLGLLLRCARVQGCGCFFQGESYIRQYPAPMAIYPLRTALGSGFHFIIGLLLALVLALCWAGPSEEALLRVFQLLALLSLLPTFAPSAACSVGAWPSCSASSPCASAIRAIWPKSACKACST